VSDIVLGGNQNAGPCLGEVERGRRRTRQDQISREAVA
jgi:hypothetical protein